MATVESRTSLSVLQQSLQAAWESAAAMARGTKTKGSGGSRVRRSAPVAGNVLGGSNRRWRMSLLLALGIVAVGTVAVVAARAALDRRGARDFIAIDLGTSWGRFGDNDDAGDALPGAAGQRHRFPARGAGRTMPTAGYRPRPTAPAIVAPLDDDGAVGRHKDRADAGGELPATVANPELTVGNAAAGSHPELATGNTAAGGANPELGAGKATAGGNAGGTPSSSGGSSSSSTAAGPSSAAPSQQQMVLNSVVDVTGPVAAGSAMVEPATITAAPPAPDVVQQGQNMVMLRSESLVLDTAYLSRPCPASNASACLSH